MNFWASSESDAKSGTNLDVVRASVEAYLNRAFAESILEDIDLEIRYVPIVMSEASRARYPARSRARLKSKIYDCAPQLPYEPFITGDWSDRVEAYLLGLEECSSALLKFGATDAQVVTFRQILRRAYVDLTK